MSQTKANFFGKKLPAWLLLAALVVVGAGAATGLVLKDQINGTTTIAVSQAIRVAYVTGGGDADEFLGTVDDDGMAWAAHFEANNGDVLYLEVGMTNYGREEIATLTTCSVPDGITVSNDDPWDIVEIAPHTWKGQLMPGTDGFVAYPTGWVIALEDAQPTGFYEISCTTVPVNV